MLTTTGSLSQVVDAAVRGLFDQGRLDLSATLYGPKLGFTQYEPDVPSEQLSTISGPGYGVVTVEGQQYGSNDLYRGYPVTLKMQKFSSELRWTEEDIHWIQKQPSSKRASTFTSIVKHAVNALNGNLNLEACKVYYLGFGTTNLTGGDSLALFTASHTIRKTGGTASNIFGDTHRALSASNFVDGVNLMNRFVNHNNVQMLPCKRVRLLVSVENAPLAQQILNSLYGPSNANLGLQTGSKEAFSGRGVDVDFMVLYDMPTGYKNYWFVIDLDRAAELAWLAVGWMPRLNEETIIQKGQYVNEASAFFGYVFSGWQWAFGSIGSGNTV
jgi:hypothetical protein